MRNETVETLCQLCTVQHLLNRLRTIIPLFTAKRKYYAQVYPKEGKIFSNVLAYLIDKVLSHEISGLSYAIPGCCLSVEVFISLAITQCSGNRCENHFALKLMKITMVHQCSYYLEDQSDMKTTTLSGMVYLVSQCQNLSSHNYQPLHRLNMSQWAVSFHFITKRELAS